MAAAENQSNNLAEQIATALGLNEQQRRELSEIVRGHLGPGEWMRKLPRELVQASASGDTQHSAELREQLQQIRDNPGSPMASILDELEPILSDRQAELLHRLQNPRGRSVRSRSASGGPCAPCGSSELLRAERRRLPAGP